MNTTIDTPKLFLTDYASYNEGKQFEFGHWVDLTDFSDVDEFLEYINNHFEEADKISPLFGGCKREEVMFTDFENFPRALYGESMGESDLEKLFEFINLDDDDKIRVAFIMEQTNDVDYALSHYENVHLTEYDYSNRAKWDLFEMYYPEIEELSTKNDYLTIDYDRFIDENFTEFEYNGTTYLVDDNWN